MSVPFISTQGYILIEQPEIPTQTENGLYIPISGKNEKPQIGIVLAVGDDETQENGTKRKSPVKVGQTVVYKKWGADGISDGGKDYLFVKFGDIIGIQK